MGITKKIIRRYWPVIWIVVLWLIFSQPYLLKGLAPFPSGYLVNFFSPWNNYFGFPFGNNAMPDVISQLYPWKTVVIESWKFGQIPFWNPYQFAGNPQLANVQSAVFTPLNMLFFVLPFVHAWSILILLQPLLAGLFTYLFVRKLKVSRAAAVLSAISFMFAGFITVWMAYGTLAYAILYFPLVLYGIERYRSKPDLAAKLIVVFSIPLSLFSGHFQTSIYMLLAGASYGVYSFWLNKRKLLSLSMLFLVGLIISLPQLIPAIQFYQQSVRSGLYEVGEVIPWSYLITVLAPDFYGNPVTRNDWFGHYAEWSSFAGVIPVMLAIFVLFLDRKSSKVRFFGVLAAFSLLLAYQTPLIDLLAKLKIPVLATSAASRIIVLFSFGIAVLSGFGLDRLIVVWSKHRITKKMMLFFGVWIVLVIGAWGMLLSNNLFFLEKAGMQEFSIAKRNFILPTFFIFSGIVVIFLGYFVKKEIYIKLLILGLLVVVSFDVLRFSTKWMPFDLIENMYPENGALTYLQKNVGNYRVFGNFGNEGQTPFKLQGIEGYDPLYVSRYGEFVSAAGDGHLRGVDRSVVLMNKNGEYTKSMLDLLGVKYYLQSKGDGRNIWVFPFWEYPESFGSAVWSDEKYEIYENTTAYPRAYVVHDYIVADSDQEVIDSILADDTDLRETAILEEKPQDAIEPCKGEDKVAIVNYSANRIELDVSTDCPGLLFMSDNYYPGWNVYLDGTKSNIYRANYTFRAVVVPEGDHKVIFKYENWYF
ncbi:hypothetical protein COW99_02510 [Candidatus Roizmanbacteria bacterium CG22_combo_CG10-13_8_21_14_all_38_20]|uniref:YfhO family protein n=1 Tax=Candidatus Roizmanbacteria bacterium CG22_combo_CG10-13_8_21_14_all_38_20 TaxID=1974862 RepID=A0A2H0BXN5_9BACT|nr:YfhO family protein [Candidatus Microgenomates bacterium]PIP61728.1 MAG: hypothetical protein COW99_02510 [Candidatus Roizmanbacteria bacterium CG22_combo_CG10-13_8_21_14_all_38_20]PJC32035.1 MAG: hypothetical protein CO050_00895 [Candidatus Roizmanbacteria bacterium CG_4_9_14_0_2_um_filter_38_17]